MSGIEKKHQNTNRQVTLTKSKDQMVQAVSPAESLSNRPMLPKLAELQLLLKNLKFLCAGLLRAELSKRDSILSCAGHLLEMLHLLVMPNGIQNQLKKVDFQLLGRHGKMLHKVQANQCLKGRNKIGDTKQFSKEGGRRTPNLLCKVTAKKQVF